MSQWKSISELVSDVSSGKVSALNLVDLALKTIENHHQFQAIIIVLSDEAKKRAQAIDELVKQGKPVGRLAGVPFIAKDNFLVFGGDTTAASNILKGFVAPYQSTVINKLEAEGAICVAKANLDAFAHGASTENSDFFTTKNPHDETRVPGGSSGGSAAAVILDMVPFALGTDTGGSTRQPASFVGCVGYKPTYGLMSRSGIVAMASSTDVVGTLARTVDDAAIVIDVMAGKDRLDGTTIERDETSYMTFDEDIANKRIGVIKEYMDEGVSEEVRHSVKDAIEKLKKAGAKIDEVSLPSLPLALAVYYILCPAEVSSNLGRYDGQRFGYTYKDAKNLDESYNTSRSIGFGKEAKRRIMIGTFVLSSGYYDAYYKKAQIIRTKLIDEFNQVFQNHDFLIGPVAPTTAFKIGEKAGDPLQMYLADILTVAANLTGIPAISIPGLKSNGLPVGIQLMAPQKHDRKLLSLAKKAEAIL